MEEYGKEDAPPRPISFPNAEWRLLDAANRTLIFRRPETISALNDFRKQFRTGEWRRKWSEDFIWGFERELIAAAIDDPSGEKTQAALLQIASELDAQPPEWLVILPLTHLLLGEYEMVFPKVEIKTMTESRLADVRQGFRDIIVTTSYTDDVKANLDLQANEITQLLMHRACAFVAASGDSLLAKESAIRATEPITDFLQIVATLNVPSLLEVRISIGGDLLTKQPPILIVRKDGSAIENESKRPFGHRLELRHSHIQHMRAIGFGALLDALRKSADEQTEFEQMLIRATHWIADGERQARVENKATSYITAIDMFFATKDEPVTRDITEGTAVLLGKTLEQRKTIRRRMSTFYGMRSKVSHLGSRVEDEDAIHDMRNYAVNFLAEVCQLASRFATKDDFRAWMADERITPHFIPTAETDQSVST
jgi:hypothetical protein